MICGDALVSQTYQQLMGDRLASAVFVDPPYNVRIDGFVTGSGKVHHAEFAMAAGEMTSSEFTNFLSTTLSHLAKFSVQGSLHYICMDWRHLKELLNAAERNYTELKNLCIWVKDSGGLGSLYRSQHELVFVFKNGKMKHSDLAGEICTRWNERESTWRKSGSCQSRGTSQRRS